MTYTEENTSKYADVNGVKIHYNDMGEGPVLVMLHGFGPGASGWSNYSRNVEELSKHFRLLLVDIPGFGKSDIKPDGVSIPGWQAERIGEFLDVLDIDKAHFVGNSGGGWIAGRLALDRPEKVDKLILMGPGGGLSLYSIFPSPGIAEIIGFYEGDGPSMEKLRNFSNQIVFDPSDLTDELLTGRLETAMQQKFIDNPPMRFTPGTTLDPLWSDPRLQMLPHKTLIIWGREDRVNPVDQGIILQKLIPNARFYTIPQCGHWAQWEHVNEFNAMVKTFIEVA